MGLLKVFSYIGPYNTPISFTVRIEKAVHMLKWVREGEINTLDKQVATLQRVRL